MMWNRPTSASLHTTHKAVTKRAPDAFFAKLLPTKIPIPGVKTMINILGRKSRSSNDDGEAKARGSGRSYPLLDNPGLGVRHLVLQPMDARLDYMRRLRLWLRENSWEITEVKSEARTYLFQPF